MMISFSKKFYNLTAIENSIRAYAGLAAFNVEKNKRNFVTKVSNIDKEVKNIFRDEFCNYVLSEMKNKSQWIQN
jgi:hypothetical protein